MKIKDAHIDEMQAADVDLLKGTDVWTDITNMFKDTFRDLPRLEIIELSAANLKSDLEAHFKSKYSLTAILRLLENGFKQTDGKYLFKRTDFYPESVKQQSEAANA